jgi:hypothetical protein
MRYSEQVIIYSLNKDYIVSIIIYSVEFTFVNYILYITF